MNIRHDLLDNKDWLDDQYNNNKLSTIKISKLCNCSAALVSKKLKIHEIKSRSISKSMGLISSEISNRNKRKWNDDEYRAKITNSIKKRYDEDDDLRDKTAQGGIEYWESSTSRVEASRRSKKLWSDDDYRNRVIDIQKAIWDDNKKSEYSDVSKLLWKDDEYRNKTELAIREACVLQEWREAQSVRTIGYWQNSEYRNKVKESLDKVRKTEEYKRKLALANINRQNYSSSLERIFGAILNDINIEYEKVVVGWYEFDFKINRLNCKPLLIEIQGDYWHRDRPLDKSKKTYYDRYLSHRYDFEYVYESDFFIVGKIFKFINDNIKKIYTQSLRPRDLKFCEILNNEANEFYAKYHYLGYRGRMGYSFGLRFKDRLVACCTFNGVTRKQSAERLGLNTKQIRELTRLCVCPEFLIKNGCSYLLSRAIKNLKKKIPSCKCLLAFADTTIGHTGAVYKASNWIFDGDIKPSYHYEKDGLVAHKKTIWDQAKRMCMSENEYANKYGFLKVKGKKKLRFIKWL